MAEVAPGTTLRSRYRLERRLGVGGFGTVWAAADLAGPAAARVAVKVLSAAALETRDGRERFAREAQILSTLDHPGIVRALDFDAGDPDTPPFLVLELVQGQDLGATITARARVMRPAPLAEDLAVFIAIGEAVAAAHAQGIVHRDLKPMNVMLREGEPAVKVLDFGLAKILHGDVLDATTLGRRMGSFLYMAPEQALGQLTSPATDVFALGVLLFEQLTLHRPWVVDAQGAPMPALDGLLPHPELNNPTTLLARIARGERPVPSQSRPGLPAELDALIGATLDARPEARPSVADVLQAVRQLPHLALPETSAPSVDVEAAVARLPVLDAAAEAPDDTAVRADEAADDDAPTLAPTLAPTPPLAAPPRRHPQRGLLLIGGLVAALGLVLFARRPAPQPTSETVPASTPKPLVAPSPRPTAVAPSPTVVPVAAPSPTPTTPARARKSRAKRPPRPRPTTMASGLRRRLAALRAHPEDLARLEALARAIRAEAAKLEDRALATRIERRVHAALMIGDVDALAWCVAALETE